MDFRKSVEVFWGQLNEGVWIVTLERFLETAKQAMGRQVFAQEFADRPALADEFSVRTPEATLNEILAKIPAQRPDTASGARYLNCFIMGLDDPLVIPNQCHNGNRFRW